MPCYLFTYHAYGSWMPDRRQGYVKRRKVILPPDDEATDQYRRHAREQPATFNERVQRLVIGESLAACNKQGYTAHFVATDLTHVHMLASWQMDRTWKKVCTGIKRSLTRHFNEQFDRRVWFSENASRKKVKDREHLGYLLNQYLPSHRGWKWRKGVGYFR